MVADPRGARFFHTLVILGAAVSAAACGGRSANPSDGEGGRGGSSGSGGTQGRPEGGKAGAIGGGAVGGGGGGSGGAATMTAGGAATMTAGGATGAAGHAGTMTATGPFPAPELPTSQWNCRNAFMGCVDALGVTAHQLSGDCPVDPTLPKSAADCASDEIYSCALAVTVSGDPVLVNCECWQNSGGAACVGCASLNYRNGDPVSCTPTLKICECAYTGILR